MSTAPPPSRLAAQQRQDYGSEEMNYDEPECPRALSDLQLNLRINQGRPSSRSRNVSRGYWNQAREGSSLSSNSVSAGEDCEPPTKSRPLMLSLNPDKKAIRPRDGSASVAELKLPCAREDPERACRAAKWKKTILASRMPRSFSRQSIARRWAEGHAERPSPRSKRPRRSSSAVALRYRAAPGWSPARARLQRGS